MPRYLPMRNENICPHKNLCTDVHRSIIYNSQKLETTQMSINYQWLNKISKVENEILFRNKRNKVLIHATTWMNLKNINLKNAN